MLINLKLKRKAIKGLMANQQDKAIGEVYIQMNQKIRNK